MNRLILIPLVCLVVGCVEVNPNDRFDITEPSREEFTPVGLYLEHRCGSLDCHGSIARNLKLYGEEGLRCSPTGCAGLLGDGGLADVPGGGRTTTLELDADYRSVVGLEPEIMSSVVEEHGAHPERLSMVAKPLGLQSHKGLKLFSKGDTQYDCIVSWLAGAVDTAACTDATDNTP